MHHKSFLQTGYISLLPHLHQEKAAEYAEHALGKLCKGSVSDEWSQAWLLQQLIDETMVPVAVRKIANNLQPVTCAKVLGPHQVHRCDLLSGSAHVHT